MSPRFDHLGLCDAQLCGNKPHALKYDPAASEGPGDTPASSFHYVRRDRPCEAGGVGCRYGSVGGSAFGDWSRVLDLSIGCQFCQQSYAADFPPNGIALVLLYGSTPHLH